MRGEFLDVGDGQAGGGQRPLRGEQREVLVVLVVDGVVLPALDQPQQVRELQRDQPGRLHQRGQPGGEPDQVRHVGVDVVAGDQVGPAVPGGQLGAGLGPQEVHLGTDPPGPRHLRDVRRRLHPEHRDAPGDEVLEQVTVVAGHLGDQAVRAESERLGHRVGVPLGVRDPGIGIGGEIGVVGENVLPRHICRQLHEQATGADPYVQRVEGLGAVQPVLGQVALAQRRHAQVHERLGQCRATEPTFRNGHAIHPDYPPTSRGARRHASDTLVPALKGRAVQ